MLKAEELPFISKFYKPDGIQLEALDFLEELDDQKMSRVLLMIEKIKEVIIRSILLTNSTLLQIDCTTIVDKADLQNNACERGFSFLDHVNRTRSNLSFVCKEAIVCAKQNGFIRWFKNLPCSEQDQLLRDAKKKCKVVFEGIKQTQNVEEELRIEQARLRREFNLAKETAMENKLKMLSEKVHFCIPTKKREYGAKIKECKAKTGHFNEAAYLKTLLKIKQITLKSRNLPRSAFTVSANGKQLSTVQLRLKFCELLE